MENTVKYVIVKLWHRPFPHPLTLQMRGLVFCVSERDPVRVTDSPLMGPISSGPGVHLHKLIHLSAELSVLTREGNKSLHIYKVYIRYKTL